MARCIIVPLHLCKSNISAFYNIQIFLMYESNVFERLTFSLNMQFGCDNKPHHGLYNFVCLHVLQNK